MIPANLKIDASALMECGSEYCYELQELCEDKMFHCFICDGTGAIPDDTRMPDCDRFMIGQQCPVCNGTGRAPLEDQEKWGYRRWHYHNFWP